MSNEEVKSSAQDLKPEQVKPTNFKVEVPTVKELLKVGAQFGHETRRWNPKMQKFIYGAKNNIHIIDINQTESKLLEASKFLADASSRGQILFVGTKRQSSEIVRNEAVKAGAYFIDVRWAGGLLTNFPVVKKSLAKLNNLEKSFEEGVEDRTKYEVSRMKKEWQRLNRLYSGIKALNAKPTAVVIVDTNYEKSAVREARKIRVPIIGLVDTNCDPESADYVIPVNDDAIGSLKLILKTLSDAVLVGNKNNGVKHNLKDYMQMEIKIMKPKEVRQEEEKIISAVEQSAPMNKPMKEEAPKSPRSRTKVKGILERAKEEANKKAEPKAEKPATKKAEKPVVKAAKPEIKKEEKKPLKKAAAKPLPKKAKK